jgi:hypothetical protein
MKPVRSRSWRYGQLEVSAATDARPASLASDFEDDVVGASRQPQHGIVLRRRHRESLGADDVLVET